MFIKESNNRCVRKHSQCYLVGLIIRENINIAHQVDCSFKYNQFRTGIIYHIETVSLIIACHITLKRLTFFIKHTSHTGKLCHTIFVIATKNNVVIMPALINQVLGNEVVNNRLTDATLFTKIRIKETIILCR